MKHDERPELFLSPVSFWLPRYFSKSAWIEHAPFAFWLVEKLQPGALVELGVDRGYSYFSFCQAVDAIGVDARCYAIDTWQGDEHAGFYGGDVLEQVKHHNDEHYASFSKLIRATFDEAVSAFPDGSIDLLHIDGRHFYEDVKHDFETWRPKLSKRAVVLFHDTQVTERGFGIYRFWREIQSQYASFEFEHGFGLGVLAVGSHLPDELRDFFNANNKEDFAGQVRHIYSRLGHALSLEVDAREKIQASIDLSVSLYLGFMAHNAIQSYSEDRSTTHPYPPSGERAHIDLSPPPDLQPLASIRLDIANAPAAIDLYAFALYKADGTEIWRWGGGCELFVSQVDMACLPDDQGVTLLSLSDDPRCELALSQEVLSQIHGGCFLRLELTARPLLDALPDVLSRLQIRSETALPVSMRPQLPASAAGHLAELGELLKAAVVRKNATITAQKAEIDALQNCQQLLSDQLVRAEAQLDLLKQMVLPEAGSRLERL